MINPAYEIERLLQYGERHGMIDKLDKIIARNKLLDLLKIKEPFYGEIPDEYLKYPWEILEKIVDYAEEAGLLIRTSMYTVNFLIPQ